MKQHKKHKTGNPFPLMLPKWLILPAVLFLLLAAPQLTLATGAKIAIFPFTINAKDDLSFMKSAMSEMLSSRLSREFRVQSVNPDAVPDTPDIDAHPLDENEICDLGKKLDADFILIGSLTVIGESFSIDAKLIPIATGKSVSSFFKQDVSTDKIIPAVAMIADQIQETLSTPSDEKAFSQTPAFEDNSMIPPSAHFRISRPFDIAIKGIAVGDVDGDKKFEAVIIGNKDLHILRFEKEALKDDVNVPLPKNQSHLTVDVADINKNGRAEIFITSERAGTGALDSFVMEWDGKAFREIFRKANWYYRVVNRHSGEPQLLVQERGVADLFYPGIYRIEWTGDNYTPKERLTLPGDITVFGVATGCFFERNMETVAALNPKDKLSLFNQEGTCVWESESRYGGSENFVEREHSTTGESQHRIYLSQRLLAVDLDNEDGKEELILVENEESSGRIFSQFRNYKSGRFNGFSWNGHVLVRIIQTDKFEGYIADYAMGDMDNDGKTELIAVLVKTPVPMYRKASSVIISCPFSILTGKKEKSP